MTARMAQRSESTVDEHYGESRRRPESDLAYAIAGGRNDESIDTTGDERLKSLDFTFLRFVATDEERLIIACRCKFVDVIDKLGEKGILKIGNDNPNRTRLLRSETRRYLVGSIIERPNSPQYFLPQMLGHGTPAGQHIRGRSGRNPSSLGDILYRWGLMAF